MPHIYTYIKIYSFTIYIYIYIYIYIIYNILKHTHIIKLRLIIRKVYVDLKLITYMYIYIIVMYYNTSYIIYDK